MKNKPVSDHTCNCGSGASYEACCGQYHSGPRHLQAPTAEALMRSRYCAYSRGLVGYLLDTWHSSTRPVDLPTIDAGLRWLGLEVKRHVTTAKGDAEVEFVARSKLGGRGYRLHETSRFVQEGGRWYYVDGELH